MKNSSDLPDVTRYRIGAVCYKIRAVFPEEGSTLQEKMVQLLSEKARDAVCTFDKGDVPTVE